LPSTKLFRHGFDQNCSAMATQKLEQNVQQHDEVVESSKTGCMSQSRAHDKAYEQVPALICDTYARCILRAATIWGGKFALYEQNNPPKCFGILLKFHHPPHFGLRLQVKKPALPNDFQTLRFPMNFRIEVQSYRCSREIAMADRDFAKRVQKLVHLIRTIAGRTRIANKMPTKS